MWTSKNRGRYDRSKLRYPSDLTDDARTELGGADGLLPSAACRPNWHPSDIVLKNGRDWLCVSAGIGRLELAATAGEQAHATPPRG